ncbi:MAG: hypothetical protein IJT91_04615 [Clostridia bacterium]|nr:hypothetical protein [Clostridia bacterium]
MTGFLITLARISLFMSPVILVLLAASRLLKNRYTARCAYLVWAVVVLRLIVILTLPGLVNLNVRLPLPAAVPETRSVSQPEDTEASNVPSGSQKSGSGDGVEEPRSYDSGDAQQSLSENEEYPVREDQTAARPKSADILPYLPFAIWLAGAAVFAAYNATGYLRARAAIGRHLTQPGEEDKRIFDTAVESMGIRRAPRFAVCTGNAGPMIYGFIRPTVIIPDMELSPEEKNDIIRHELTHHKRRHLWIKLAGVAARTLHWFNPLVHIAVYRMNRNMELSCDEELLRGRSEEERRGYGNTLIRIIGRSVSGAAGLTTSFDPGKKTVRERFENIMDSEDKRGGRVVVASVLILSAIIGIVGFSALTAKAEQPEEVPEESSEISEDISAGTDAAYVDSEVRYGVIYSKETEEDPPILTELREKEPVRSAQPGDRMTGILAVTEAYHIVIWTENGALEISLTLPNDYASKNYPAIIWLPDATVTDSRFANIAYRGYAVFAVYSRGYNGSRSTGTHGFGDDADVNDVKALVDLARSCTFIDKSRIFAVGSSSYGSVAVQRYVTENRGHGIRALALADPIADIPAFNAFMSVYYGWDDDVNEFYRHNYGGSPGEAPREYDKYSSVNSADKFDIPLLVAYFSNGNSEEEVGRRIYDRQPSPGFVDKLREYGKDVTEKEFDFAGTDFYAEESIRYLTNWFRGIN